jgi:hypothetical protein
MGSEGKCATVGIVLKKFKQRRKGNLRVKIKK